jgi:hypothetical protein
MTDQFIVLKNKYKYNVPAAALFFSNNHKALRVEVPDIGKEFTDSAYIGKGASSRIRTLFALVHDVLLFHCKDPEGFIYYNHLDSFNGSVNYTINKLTNSDGHTLAHIKFYRESPDSCHAEVCCMLFSSINSLMLFYSISSLPKIPYVLLRLSAWLAENILMNHRLVALPGRAWMAGPILAPGKTSILAVPPHRSGSTMTRKL